MNGFKTQKNLLNDTCESALDFMTDGHRGRLSHNRELTLNLSESKLLFQSLNELGLKRERLYVQAHHHVRRLFGKSFLTLRLSSNFLENAEFGVFESEKEISLSLNRSMIYHLQRPVNTIQEDYPELIPLLVELNEVSQRVNTLIRDLEKNLEEHGYDSTNHSVKKIIHNVEYGSYNGFCSDTPQIAMNELNLINL